MDSRRHDMSANISFMQKHAVDKAFQSLLEESIIYEGPIIQKKFINNRTDLDLSSARADLFSSIKNKTFDKGWRQEVAKKSMSFSQNQSRMFNLPAKQPVNNCSMWRNVSSFHNVGSHASGITSKKQLLLPHKELSSSSKSKAPAKFPAFKIPLSKKSPLKTVQEETNDSNNYRSASPKHHLRSHVNDLAKNLQTKDVKKERRKSPMKLKTSEYAKKSKYSPQKRNLEPYEMVHNDQKYSLRSFTRKHKHTAPSTSEVKTVSSRNSTSKNVTESNKRKRKTSLHKKSSHEPNPKRRNTRISPSKTQKCDSKIQKTNNKKQNAESPRLQKTKSTTRETEFKSPESKSKPKPPLLPSKVTSKQQYLDKWIIYHDEKEVFLKGHVKDRSSDTYWRSTPIVRRINNCVVETMSGTTCIISGPPFAAAMLSKGYTEEVLKKFHTGIPPNYLQILKQNSSSKSKIPEKRSKLDEERRIHPVNASNNLKSTENATTTAEMTSTFHNNVPSEKSLQESSLSDEISNPSEVDDLTEMDSTVTDFLQIFDAKDRNKNPSSGLNNYSVKMKVGTRQKSSNSATLHSKLKKTSSHNVIDNKIHKLENEHHTNSPQFKKPINKKSMKQQQEIQISLESNSSEESNMPDSDFKISLRKRHTKKESRYPTRKSNSPTRIERTSSKRKVSSSTRKSLSPMKQKQLHPKSRKSKSPPKKSVSKTEKNRYRKGVSPKRTSSSSDSNFEASTESDTVSTMKMNKPNEKISKRSSSKNEATKRKDKKSSNSAAKYEKKESIWTTAEIECMKRTMSTLPPADPKFWSKVAKKVGKSTAECRAQYSNKTSSSSNVNEPHNSKKNKSKSAGKSPKLKVDTNELQHNFDDELFESENVKKSSNNLNFNPEDKLEDIFGDLCALTPRPSSDTTYQSSVGKFLLTPVSERHTPTSSFSDMEVKIDWDNATHCIKKFKRNQMKGAGRLKAFNKKLDLNNLEGPRNLKTKDLVSQLNKLNKIPTKSKNNAESEADDSEELLYFSDSDFN